MEVDIGGGRARVVPADGADASVDIGAFGAMLSGSLVARDAVRLGRLRNASPTLVAQLDLCFSDGAPWSLEMF